MDMQKIQALLLEKDKDVVVRYLGEAGLVHFKQVDVEHIEDKEYLVPFKTPPDVLNRYLYLKEKIESFFKDLKIGLNDYSPDITTPTGETGDILLESLEKRIEKIPLDQIVKLNTFNEKINRFLETLSITDEVTVTKQSTDIPIGTYIEDLERKLSDIELRFVGLQSSEAVHDTNLNEPLIELKQNVEIATQKLSEEFNYDSVIKEATTIHFLVNREIQVIQLQDSFFRTKNLVYFEGWALPSQMDEVKQIITEVTKGTVVLITEPPNKHDEVPTILPKNPQIFNAFEKLTYAFGYPRHTEVNSIPLMAITFTIFFGLMFADVGQGILLAVIGLLLTQYKKKVNVNEMGELVRYFLIASEMFVLLGISASFFGLLFGEFFGPSEIIHPISLGRIGPFHFGGFDPAHEPMKMLRLAILFGVIHQSTGLGLNIVNNVRAKHRHEILVSACWLWLLWGGFFMWVNYKGLSQVQNWLSVGQVPLIGLIVTPLLLIMVLTSMHGGITEGLGFSVEVFAETLSHTLSYARLMALGLIHSAMSSIFLALAGVEHGHFKISGIPVLIAGTAMVMFIEGLVVFIHNLRLHWVEWFSKFYRGEGIIFIPYKFKIVGTR